MEEKCSKRILHDLNCGIPTKKLNFKLELKSKCHLIDFGLIRKFFNKF